MDWLFLFEVVLAGLGAGTLYSLVGIAFVLIYKATHVVNFAIGEIAMLGAYLGFGFLAGLGFSIWVALPLVLLLGGIFGGIAERIVIRPLLGEDPISVFMVTVGLGSVLVGFVELAWGPDTLRLPDFLPTAPIFLGDAYISPKIAYGAIATISVIAAFLAVFKYSRIGVALRSTAADQGAAYSMGINVPRVFSISWIIACASAAGAGVMVGYIGGISPQTALFGLSVLVVVMIGGLDSIVGALVAGLLVGVIEALSGVYLGGEYRQMVTFSLLLIVLIVRPYGLFGTVQIERL